MQWGVSTKRVIWDTIVSFVIIILVAMRFMTITKHNIVNLFSFSCADNCSSWFIQIDRFGFGGFFGVDFRQGSVALGSRIDFGSNVGMFNQKSSAVLLPFLLNLIFVSAFGIWRVTIAGVVWEPAPDPSTCIVNTILHGCDSMHCTTWPTVVVAGIYFF